MGKFSEKNKNDIISIIGDYFCRKYNITDNIIIETYGLPHFK